MYAILDLITEFKIFFCHTMVGKAIRSLLCSLALFMVMSYWIFRLSDGANCISR